LKIKSDSLHSLFVRAASSILIRKRDILHGEWGGEKCVCISFDCDFPEDMNACGSIVTFLEAEKVPASFAIPGQLAIAFPSAVDELIEKNQEIMNHTLSHFSNFRNMATCDIRFEVEGFQELMAKEHNYLPKGFRCPHGLRNVSVGLFEILKENSMYDSSILGYNVIKIDGVWEIPLAPCPEHPLMAFDTYHHFRFPLFLSSEKKMLKLWITLLSQNTFINLFLDPLDLVTETRLCLLKNMIRSAKEQGFIFNQTCQIYDRLCKH